MAERKHPDSEQKAPPVAKATPVRYIAYPVAMKLLSERLDATPDELAAWLFMGNLEAFLNANELDPPPKFSYGYYFGDGGDFDYLAPLMACWFREDDIASFEPDDRYITGKDLIERWARQPDIRPIPYIHAKIAESRLMDMHPITGMTQGAHPKDGNYPTIESALFVLAHVEEVEAADFGGNKLEARAKPIGHLNHDMEMQQRANQIAERQMAESDRPITRNKVAKILANELGIDEATVLRRIRKGWK